MQKHEGNCDDGEESVQGEHFLEVVHQILFGEVKHLSACHVLIGQFDGTVILL